jgi:hypothetical protein
VAQGFEWNRALVSAVSKRIAVEQLSSKEADLVEDLHRSESRGDRASMQAKLYTTPMYFYLTLATSGRLCPCRWCHLKHNGAIYRPLLSEPV